ncbi:GntR family transcriptional regulator [Solibacillus silvestris]|uniref:GntR family transcriptional regulator n=1 Tax=Solibacillus silvestris TaxID=76853 RepID=UPI003F7DDDF1
MTMDFAKDRPIYLQLVEMVCGDVIKGKLKPGDKLSSVREFAIDTGVNVNTIQRVYKELEMMNLTETKRGQGTFITTDTAIIHDVREQMKEQVAAHFISSIQSFGFTLDEIIEVLKKNGGR